MLSKNIAAMASAEIASHAMCKNMAAKDRDAAAKVVFDELHLWATRNMPMGATAKVTNAKIEDGLRHVKRRVQAKEIACGIDPLTVLSVISALYSIISKLAEWWNGRGK